MLVVIDTNVLVSGLLKVYSYPARIVDLLYLGRLHCIYDDRILREYTEVLSRPKFADVISKQERRDLLGYIRRSGYYVLSAPLENYEYSAPDFDDLPFVEVAVSGQAGYLITCNYSHFTFFQHNPFEIKIVSPSEFYAVICDNI